MRFICILSFTVTIVLCMLSGCTAAEHSRQLHSERDRQFTLGLIQKEIQKGMTQTEVIEALGSPNIVTRDENGRETYVYDKIATEASYSYDSSSLSGAAGAGGIPSPTSLVLGGIGGSHQRGAGAHAQTQRTLTVVIKFDKAGRVSDFSYRSSKF